MWKPIATAPKDGTVFTAWAAHEDAYDDYEDALNEGEDANLARRAWPAKYNYQGLLWLADGMDLLKEATHWMPLPGPPND